MFVKLKFHSAGNARIRLIRKLCNRPVSALASKNKVVLISLRSAGSRERTSYWALIGPLAAIAEKLRRSEVNVESGRIAVVSRAHAARR
jgi:hypothetical protein